MNAPLYSSLILFISTPVSSYFKCNYNLSAKEYVAAANKSNPLFAGQYVFREAVF